MKKYLLLLLFAVNCSSFKDNIKDELSINKGQIMNITYDNSQALSEITFSQDDEKETIALKNKDKTWKITYKDFKILTLGYKNWRVVENEKPEISKITEDSNWVNFTFNYYKTMQAENNTKVKVSILSGTVSINKKVVRTNEEENAKKNMKWWIVGLGSYSTVITIVLFAVIL